MDPSVAAPPARVVVTREDPVTPELAEYVLRRDGGCVVGILAAKLEILVPWTCRDRYGTPINGLFVPFEQAERVLTIAHVRDRAGGRMAKRPPSIARRLAAVCYGHHIADPVVDRRDVRPVVDAYLERLEGPDRDTSRPWETIRRVRSAPID